MVAQRLNQPIDHFSVLKHRPYPILRVWLNVWDTTQTAEKVYKIGQVISRACS